MNKLLKLVHEIFVSIQMIAFFKIIIIHVSE